MAHAAAGVYHGAAKTEAPAFRDRRVLVVGGGNSAGQAAMYLARYATEVHIVVRRPSLRDTMSHYLLEQIEKTPNIHAAVRPSSRASKGRIRSSGWCCVLNDGTRVESMGRGVRLIGTRPRSEWLLPDVLRDDKGFVITGRDLAAPIRADLERAPRADGARDQHPWCVRRRRHPRRRDEPRGLGGWRRIDGGPVRPRVSRADVSGADAGRHRSSIPRKTAYLRTTSRA